MDLRDRRVRGGVLAGPVPLDQAVGKPQKETTMTHMSELFRMALVLLVAGALTLLALSVADSTPHIVRALSDIPDMDLGNLVQQQPRR